MPRTGGFVSEKEIQSIYSRSPCLLEKGNNHSSGVSVFDIKFHQVIVEDLPFSAVFFSLDQVEGYRRVFSLEDPSYVSFPSVLRYRSPQRPFPQYTPSVCVMFPPPSPIRSSSLVYSPWIVI